MISWTRELVWFAGMVSLGLQLGTITKESKILLHTDKEDSKLLLK